MDTRYLGGSLMTRNEIETDRRGLTTTGEDAYYKRHTPSDSRASKIASAVTAVCFGFVTTGLWPQ
jgi:hypothetical protein